MKRLLQLSIGSVFLAILVFSQVNAGGFNLENPYTDAFVLASQDTFPTIEDRQGDYLNNPSNNPFDLQDPATVKKDVEYDPETDTYIITEKVGEEYFRMPTFMTFEEYMQYQSDQQQQQYFDQLLGVSTGTGSLAGKVDPVAQFDIKNSLVDRLFGGTTVDIRPQGNIDLTFGVDFQRVDNPALLERQRRQGGFDFDMAIQMDVQGKIGEKLDLAFNYNTQATFDFENPIKLDYNTDNFSEDEIVKKIEAGTVSLPLRGSLIQGSQSLFGLKTELQFGRLRVTAVASQQKSERERITLEGGSQIQEFEVKASEYDENRHFFLSHYNRNVFEESLENLPQIKSLFRIQKIQVWITNDRREFENVRDIVAVADLGEPNQANMTQSPSQNLAIQPPVTPRFRDITGQYGLPDNFANPIYDEIVTNPRAELVDRVVSEMQKPPLNFQQARDFEKVSARQLRQSEYTFNPELGFLSVNINVAPDQVLGVAYQYTYKDSTFQVGQFADDVPQAGDSIQDQKVLFVKMLKSTTQRVDVPAWDLMMKNVYPIGAFQVSQEDFKLDIYYQEPGGGEKRFLPDTEIKGKPLLNVFNLDNLNTQGDPQPDGVFDFVTGITINPRNGRIMFPVLEPFGIALGRQIPDPVDSARYVYQQLYDSTKIRALESAFLNRFVIRGSYKSSVSSEISLGTFNIPPGSVTVSAGGQILQEGRDYEVDYNIGRVKILNDALLASGTPINVDFEDNTLFGFQTKTLLGLRGDFQVNPNFNIGATYLHLFERPFTPKVNIGDDPINNRIYGLDVNFSQEAPFITRLVDMLPLIQTKAPSNISFTAEGAYLDPGHARAINEDSDEEKGGVVYIDDFEGSISAIPLHTQPNAWVMSSIPQNIPNAFPESREENSTLSGVNRALMNWYRIDDAVRDQNEENPYVMRIPQTEVFRNFSNASGNFLQNTAQTFDITYYPSIRGSYNFDPPSGTQYSAGLNNDGSLKAPETRWAGIMRDLTTNDFQATNVEFIEFWVLSPFLKPDGSGDPVDNPEAHEGVIYFNLGNISEDILKDSRKFFENGLPSVDSLQDQVAMTQWGRVPISPQITTAFDADPERRSQQDIGLDGLTNEDEINFFADYLDQLDQANLFGPLVDQAKEDPSNDDYIYYNDPEIPDTTGTLPRYLRYNHTQGNTPSATENNSTVTFGRTTPDMEDLNNDLTLNETESYFQYRVPIEWDGDRGINLNNEFVTDSVMSPDRNRIWYRFKIPLDLPAENPNFSRVGGIQDFRSIRFVRMYLKDFDATTTLRFARLDLVRNQWRRYILPDGSTALSGPSEEGGASFDVNDVNIEENSSKIPYGYILPPGITRERAISVNQNAQQNEQALSLNVCGLEDGKEKSIYKIVNLDLRLYEGLKMFVHGEAKQDDPSLQNGDLRVFVRMGSDFTRNYYEYEIPLELSDDFTIPYNSTDYPREVWRENNDFNINFQVFKDLKIIRNNSADPAGRYPEEGYIDPYELTKEARVYIKGNPNLGDIKGVMIGIRNPVNDAADHCAEVWVNELRVNGLSEQGGGAALARLDIQLADFGAATVAGSYSSIGFGALDQPLLERSREETMQFDLSTNLELGKFFPSDWGISIPFYAQYSEASSTPQFDPYDLDLTLDEKLEGLASDATVNLDSVAEASKDVTTIKTFTFTNVRKERTKQAVTPKPWDIENFSVSYAQTETERRDPIIESDKETSYTGALDYSYSRKSTYITPFKQVFKSNPKWLKLLTEFNFNPLPSSFNFSTIMDRQINVTTYRFTGGDPSFSTFFNKRWTWDRVYGLNWDLSKGLKLTFNATNFAVIDEPDGFIDTDAKKEQVWSNIEGFGRNKQYDHNIAINYTLPFKYIRILDWINVRATYNASFAWSAAALNTQELGNVIQNNQNRSLNGDLDFNKLYNKSKFLKDVNGRSRPRPQSPQTGRGGNQTQSNRQSGNEEENKEMSGVTKAIIRPLLLIKKFRFDFTENFGTVLPGYLPPTEYFGLTDRFRTPGWEFVAGLQPNINQEDYYTEQDFLYNNWQWITGDQLLSQQVTQNYDQNINGKLTLEPINDFRIEVEANRSFSSFHSEDFRRNEILGNGVDRFQEEYEHLNVREVGSYNITYFALNTLNQDIPALFQQFEDNRNDVALRLTDASAGTHLDTAQALAGFPLGYGRSQQAVLVPSFIAAYSGQDVNSIQVNAEDPSQVLVNILPRPNWKVTYNGLSKIKALQDIFAQINISHGYRSTLTVNQFETDLLYNETPSNNVNPVTQDFYSRFEIPDLVIQEALSPLIGIDVRTKTNMSFRMDFKKSRNLNMSFLDGGLNETRTEEYVVGFGYRVTGFNLPFIKQKKQDDPQVTPGTTGGRNSRQGQGGLGGTRQNGDLDITFDFSLRDDVTYRLILDQEVLEPTRGTRAITISPAAEYQLNKQLALRFFFDYRKTDPKVSTSFPITNTRAGVTVRFSLN